MEDDQVIDKPYRAEYAKSSRSNCKACKAQIAKDVLRLGVMVQSPVHDGKIPNWYHFMCFFGKQRPKTVQDISHFESLRWDDQEKITEKLKEVLSKGGGLAEGKEKGKKATKRGKKNGAGGFGDFTIEYAKSSRAMCRGCEIKISKDEVRISKKDYETDNARMYGGMDRWHHIECFAKLRNELEFFASGDNLPGFQGLKKEDKETVLKALPQIEGVKVKEEPKDEVDGAPSSKKVKKEEKEEEKSSKKDKELEELMKKQNKLMYKYRDILKNLPKKHLTALLLANDQEDPAGTDRKLDRLQDVMAFGALLPCTVCKKGKFIFKTGLGYQCQGNLTEWTKCMHVEEKPKRKPFVIPEDIATTSAALENYKCKLGDRAFVKDVKPKTEVKDEASTSAKVERFAPFRNMVFHLLGKKVKSNKDLKSKIEKWGGTVQSKLTTDAVAVISTEDEVAKMSDKMAEVQELNIHVVPVAFVEACKSGNAIEKIKEMCISPWGGDVESKVENLQKKSQALKSGSGKSRFSKSLSSVKLKVVGGSAVDPDSDMADTCHVYKDEKDTWSAVLGLSDVQTNKNSYYKIQLLESNTNTRYWVFRSWGRIGTKIGGKKLQSVGSLQEAKTVFMDVYFEHTNNPWKKRHNFVKYPDFMYPIDVDYGETDGLKMELESSIPSKLTPPVQDLIKMIFNVDMMKKVMMEYELDMEKMPLGKLSKKQIQKAYAVLSELQERDGDIKPHIVTDASNRFYTLIPHNFGTDSPPLLNNKEIIQSKLEMLESLLEMEIAYSLLRETKGVGEEGSNPLDSHYAKLNADIEAVEKDSEEFKIIEKYVKNTHGETHTQYNLEIAELFKVKRNGEDKRYKPFKKLHNRKLLWHGSRITNFAGILSQGLRIAPPEAPVCGYMFGKGIYFADMVSKSANYCMTSPSNPYGLLLLCQVALGDMYERTKADYIEKLPAGKHSTKGVGLNMPNPDEVLIREDGSEVPLGTAIKQFTDRTQTSLLYNEYIVYDVAQVKCEYLIKLKFNYNTF